MYIFFKIDFSDSQPLERGSTSMPLDCLIVVTAKIPDGIPCYRDDSEIHSQAAGACAHLHVPKQHCVFGGLLTLLWLYYLQVNHLFQKHPEFSECVLSHVQLFATPWTITHQAPLSMDFPGKNTEVDCISSSRGPSQPRDQACVSCIGRQILYHWEAPGFDKHSIFIHSFHSIPSHKMIY